MKARQRICILLAGTAIAATAGLSASAQTAPASASVDEVVVTARKVTENVQDVPISMSAVSASNLTEARLMTIETISNIMPNVKVFKNTSTNDAFGIYIRGVGRDNGSFFVEAPVALYVDEVIYPYQVGPVVDIGGLDRVEVLRGPQGTLYGRNATVGAVKYVTTRPNLSETLGSYALTYGSFERAEASLGVSTPLIHDRLGVRLDVGYRTYDGYMYDRTFKENINGYKTWSGRASLLFKPSDNSEIYAAIDGTHADDELSSGTPVVYTNAAKTEWALFFGDPYQTDHSPQRDALNYMRSVGGTIQGKVELQDVTLKSITAYRKYWQFYTNDNRFRSDVAYAGSTYGAKDATFTQEFQATGDLLNERVRYVAGVFYLNSLTRSFTGQPPTAGQPVWYTQQRTISLAGYVDATAQIVGGLSISGGVRLTRDEKKVAQSRVSFTTNFSGTGDATFDDTSPRVSLDYKVNDDVLLYASWGRGFKGGALQTNAPATAADIGIFVPPEIAENTEIGAKTEWLDHRLRLNVNYFWLTVADQTSAVRNALNQTVLVFNDVESSGLEVEAVAKITPAFTLRASGATLHSQYVNVDPTNTAIFSLTDKTPKHNPEFTYDIAAEYQLDSLGPLPGSLKLSADYSYVDDFWGCLGNVSVCRQEGYGVTNASATWTSPNQAFQVVLAGTNIGDVAYFKNGSSGNGVLVSQWYLPPAEYSITFRQKF